MLPQKPSPRKTVEWEKCWEEMPAQQSKAKQKPTLEKTKNWAISCRRVVAAIGCKKEKKDAFVTEDVLKIFDGLIETTNKEYLLRILHVDGRVTHINS